MNCLVVRQLPAHYKNGIKFIMENSRPKGDDEKLLESKRPSFLESWQQRLGILPESKYIKESQEEHSEAEPSETKKSKRWQRLFGRIFGGIVRPALTEPKQTQANDTLFTQHVVPPAESVLNPEDTLTIAHEPASSNEAPVDVSDPLVRENEIPETKPRLETSTEQMIDAPAIAEAMNATIVSPDITAALNAPANERTEYKDVMANSGDNIAGERVIERGGQQGVGVAAGLFGLEFLARRRADRKLKKEIKRIDQKLNSNDRQTPFPAIEVNRTVPGSLPDQSSSPELKLSPLETPGSSVAEVQKPLKSDNKLEQNVATQSGNTISEASTMGERPDRVLEKVAKAAEKNAPIEKLFERSHEVKDQPLQQLGAAPVGVILSRSDKNGQSVFTAATMKTIEARQKTTTTAPNPSQPDLYKQAVKSGFWTAVVLVVCLGVIMIFGPR